MRGIFVFPFVVVPILCLTVISQIPSISGSPDDYLYLRIGSESMKPTFEIGTIITVRTDALASQIRAASYPDGDIVLFYKPKANASEPDLYVAHRAVANLTRYDGLIFLVTKGDANVNNDSWPDYRGQDYSWNGMISEKLLVGKVLSYSNNQRSSSAHLLGGYILFEDRFWMTANKTVQELRDQGYNITGDPDWLLQVNSTYLNYTLKPKIYDLDWPETAVQNTEGQHDLNVTAYRIMQDGSTGERLLSALQRNVAARTGNNWKCQDPGFGLGFNPTALVIGNSFEANPQEPLEYTVNRTELVAGTPWGENLTCVVYGNFANQTHVYSFTFWCDVSSGLILRQTVDSSTPTLNTHEEMKAIEVGVEFMLPQREVPPPAFTAGAIAVGAGVSIGIPALAAAGGLTQSLTESLRSMPLPEWLKEFFKLHSEEAIKAHYTEELRTSKKRRLLDRRQAAIALFSGLITTFAFSYVRLVETQDPWSSMNLVEVVPTTLLSTGIIVVTKELYEASSLRLYGFRAENRIWFLGVVALLATTFFFHLPFGHSDRPARQKRKIPLDTRALIAASKTCLLLTLLLPFSILSMFGHQVLGDNGVWLVTMTTFFSLIPVWPLAGYELEKHDWRIWSASLALAVTLFFGWLFSVFPYIVYMAFGLFFFFCFIVTIHLGRHTKERSKSARSHEFS